MSPTTDRPDDKLDDEELLDRESDEREDFMRIEGTEPQSPGTTYRVLSGSRALIDAWEKWMRTSVSARLRGLLPRARR